MSGRRLALDGSRGVSIRLARIANDVEDHGQERERDDSDDRCARERPQERRPTRNAVQDRARTARQENEQRDEQKAQVARDHVRLCEPEHDERRDDARAEDHGRAAVTEERARRHDHRDHEHEREPHDARDEDRAVDPEQGRDEDVLERRDEELERAYLHAVLDARSAPDLTDVWRVPGRDRHEREADPQRGAAPES